MLNGGSSSKQGVLHSGQFLSNLEVCNCVLDKLWKFEKKNQELLIGKSPSLKKRKFSKEEPGDPWQQILVLAGSRVHTVWAGEADRSGFKHQLSHFAELH